MSSGWCVVGCFFFFVCATVDAVNVVIVVVAPAKLPVANFPVGWLYNVDDKDCSSLTSDPATLERRLGQPR